MFSDGGPYECESYGTLMTGALMSGGPYIIPHVKVEGSAIRNNNSVSYTHLPALVFGIYCKWATRKAAITSISVGAIIICLTFFVWDLGYVWYGTIGLATAFVLMYVVSKLTKDDPKDSEDFYEALDSGHRRFMRIKAKIK